MGATVKLVFRRKDEDVEVAIEKENKGVTAVK